MREIGRILRLQIQTGSLKKGDRLSRTYDPAALLVVPALRLSTAGVVGLLDGREWLDVHHRDHDYSKNRASNGVSFNFTPHYDRMRQRFGPHLADGCAGENLLVATAAPLEPDSLAAGLLIEGADGRPALLAAVAVATPCLPFTEYALALDGKAPAGLTQEALRFLDEGVRGFYATLAGEPVLVRPGARVWLP